MKSPPTVTDDCDDIFGPPRTYATGYTPPKQRPSMISAKYRQKEERRKVLKISINKLKKIEDPEASLCRSVLINNTMKRLQKEARDEKLAKQQLNYPRCYENDNFLNLKSEFIKNEMKSSNQSIIVGNGGAYDEPQEKMMESCLKVDFVDFDNAKMTTEELNAKNLEVLNGLVDLENFSDTTTTTSSSPPSSSTTTTTTSLTSSTMTTAAITTITTTNNLISGDINIDNNSDNNRFASRKRSFDDVDDCDVLLQFYMPPTPRMLTCIDDDEEVNVTDDQPEVKRARTDVILDSSQIQCLDDALTETLSNTTVQYNNNNINTTTTTTTTSTTTIITTHNNNNTTTIINSNNNELLCSNSCGGNGDTFNNNNHHHHERLNDTTTMDVVVVDNKKDEFSVKNFINNNIPDAEARLRYNTQADNDNTSYSCGHSSIFNDLQTNVFHSLIASLET